jgi:hypothetical protein
LIRNNFLRDDCHLKVVAIAKKLVQA